MADENERTLYVGNLSDQISEENLWELFLQAGPLQKVKIPCDKDGSNKKSFGFVTFKHSVSVPYTISLMDGIRLHGRTLRLQNRSGSRPSTPSTPVDQRPPPVRSFSAPYPHRDQAGPGLMTPPVDISGGPGSGIVPDVMSLMGAPVQAAAVLNQLMSVPLSLPPPIGQFENRNSTSFGQYENQHGMSRERGRHERSRSDRSSQRYDPRNSRDNNRDSGRNRDNGRDRDGPNRWNSLQSHTNFNPQQRHMNPSPHRRGRRH